MTPDRYKKISAGFEKARVLVIGDLILDEFVRGRVSRISPEAPVPVVDVIEETRHPGGAANVARNLREFTPHAAVLGMIGTDAHAHTLKRLLADEGIHIDGVQQDPDYHTIVKTRIIARNQQVVRVDREKKLRPTQAQYDRAIAALEGLLPALDAVIVEDYGKGLIRQEFADAITERVRAAGKLLAIDPNPGNPLRWQGANVMKPNRSEAFAAAGRPVSEPVDPVEKDEAVLEVGRILLDKWACEILLLTLGEQGMMLFRPGEKPYHTPTRAKEVFDVSGAGDTAVALFTLALCAGATASEAAEVSNHASGIVVGKLGTATVRPSELTASFSETAPE
ncbi:MAG TPA: bifunctional ADP-heptose synthase [Chthoniobacteraceae bacterium]|jgi:D-beta-D-heptose 7-phosphate kinase/D-beta-D-heptose 1-phosphate adenosyltransferase|nr:bifunctional ADP-heptose synthase [Chthoniobacteraceae bacterium]